MERLRDAISLQWSKNIENIYQYGTLEPDEIRTLLIQPGEGDSPLVGQIEQHKLGDSERPYEALSYVWGSPKRDETMKIDSQEVQITHNAKRLLRHLRHERHPRRVWIDGICIDQDNLNERSHQVTLMHAIFSGASTVLIWVGESDQHTEDVFSFFKLIDEQHRAQTKAGADEDREKALGIDPAVAGAKFVSFEPKDISKITDFANRPWFRRSWTFQEACLSAESHLLCGKLQLHWRIFVSAALYLTSKGMASTFGSSADTIVALANFAAANPAHQSTYLSILLPLTRNLQTTNDHDKVFSFLGMADRTNLSPLELSYNLPVSEVYARTAKAMITQERGLSVLSGVHGPSRQGRKLPSWVPDWRLSRPSAYLHGYDWPKPTHLYRINEGAPFPNKIPSQLGPDTHILKLGGAKMDTITHVCGANEILVEVATLKNSGHLAVTPGSLNDELLLLRKKLDKIPRKLGYNFSSTYEQTGEKIFQALVRTLTADRGGLGEKGKPEWITEYTYGKLFQASMRIPVGSRWNWNREGKGKDPSQEMSALVIAMWTFLTGRKVFRTARGLLGISGEETKVGDEVWDIIGGEVPFVLRSERATWWTKPSGDGTKRLQVVGEAYVHGVMAGELWNVEDVEATGDTSDGEYFENAESVNGDRLEGGGLEFEDLELI